MHSVERRRLLKALVAAGLLPAACESRADEELSPETLERAQKLLDQGFTEERLRALAPSVQRNLDFFQIVRDTELDDSVEPAPVFKARS